MGVLVANAWWPDILVLIAVIATICGLIYYWSTSTYNYWRDRGVKTVPNVSPLLGSLKNVVLLKRQISLHFTDMYWSLDGERYGGYFKFRKPALMLRDPALVKNIMTKDFVHFYNNDVGGDVEPTDEIPDFDENDAIIAYNIFGMTGARWKYARSIFSPLFSTGKIKAMFPLIMEICEELKSNIQRKIDSDDPEFKARDVAANYSTDVVASCAFSYKAESLKDENNTFRNMGKEMMTPSIKRVFITIVLLLTPKLIFILKFFGLYVIPLHISRFFSKLVTDAFEMREKNNISRNDLIQLLLQLKKQGDLEENGGESKSKDITINKENGEFELTDNVLTAQAVTFFFNGFETSAGALSYAMHELVINPEIQTKLREELRKLVDQNEGVLTYEAVTDCAYPDQIFLETLRKHPVAGFMNKICTQRYKIPDSEHFIEKGTPVTIPVSGIHFDPKYYPDPDKFIPERFSEENKKSRVPGTFLSFGDGPRQCVAIKFAHAQVKAALATVVLNFELLPTKNTTEPVEINIKFILNNPVGGLPMKAVALNYLPFYSI